VPDERKTDVNVKEMMRTTEGLEGAK
jgi:hypothetical protein